MSPVGETGTGEENEEEGEAKMCTDCSPHSLSPCAAWDQEVQKIGNEAEHRKKGGVQERYFKVWFCYSLSYSDLIGIK